MPTPVRIQRRRTKGWRLPENTVIVSRPSKWGNPFSVAEYGRELAISNYRRRLEGLVAIGALDLTPLKGKNLACWCKLGDACHADVLLSMANGAPSQQSEVAENENPKPKKRNDLTRTKRGETLLARLATGGGAPVRVDTHGPDMALLQDLLADGYAPNKAEVYRKSMREAHAQRKTDIAGDNSDRNPAIE